MAYKTRDVTAVGCLAVLPQSVPQAKNVRLCSRQLDQQHKHYSSTMLIITIFLLLTCQCSALDSVNTGSYEQTVFVTEGVDINTKIGRIGDGLPQVNAPFIQIYSKDPADFRFEKKSGEIRTNQTIDRERKAHYMFTAVSSQYVYVSLNITVLDINDNDPVFSQTEKFLELPESTPPNVQNALGSVQDPDYGVNGTLSYEIYSGNDDNTFRLTSKRSGSAFLLDLAISGQLNYGQVKSYRLVIRAYDHGIDQRSSEMVVHIKVIDVNDHQPVFNHSKYSATLAENATIGTSVIEVFATDEDSNENGRIKYSIDSQSDPGGHFRIDPSTGIIRVNKPVDFETQTRHELIVWGVDNGSQPQEGNCVVEILVQNVNELPATINLNFLGNGNKSASIPEDSEPGKLVARISVSDPDKPGEYYSNVNVSLEGGATSFGLQTKNNVVYLIVQQKTLDREKVSHYNLTVIATDSGKPPLFASRSFTLWIADINDNAPIFSKKVYHAEIQEIVQIGASVVQVSASDKDQPNTPNSRVTYHIVDAPASHSNWFQIDDRIGLITTQDRIDCETDDQPTLTIVATDAGNPRRSSTATVVVVIRDVNDNQPTFDLSYYSVSVPENEIVGRCILTVSATDPDCGLNAQVTYSIPNNPVNPTEFSINNLTGQVCLKETLDYERSKMYQFAVQASDRGGFHTTTIVDINVQDINDNRPEFYPSVYNVNKDRNAAPQTPVITVHATDSDSLQFGKVTYKMENGNDLNLFSLNTETGVITLVKSFPSSNTVHTLEISVQDGGGLSSIKNAKVTISVTGADSHPPVFERVHYLFTVDEDAEKQTPIGSVYASLKDSGSSSSIQYAIIDGNRDDLFRIDAQTGIIYNNQLLDHDTYSSVLLNIQAQSGNPPIYGSTQVNVTINDVNDNDPKFSVTYLEIPVKEDTTQTTVIYAVKATDKDSERNGTVRYSFTDNPNNLFSIDAVTGDIRLQSGKTLNYEQNKKYSLVIKAADLGKTPRSSTMTMVIDVQDVNDNTPVFKQNKYQFSISESLAINGHADIGQITAIDEDMGNNGRVSFRIIDGTASTFGIFPTTGQLYLRELLDRETKDFYSFKVMATDNGIPARSASVQVEITIKDENDNNPVFTDAVYHFSIDENLPMGTTVGVVSASDIDSGPNADVAYSFLTSHLDFVINPHTGHITTVKQLDRENRRAYSLKVRAQDGGKHARSTTADVNIRVLDANDNMPVFRHHDNPFVVNVDENRPKGTKVVQMIAEDVDEAENGMVSYHLEGNTDSLKFFEIHMKTGWVTTKEVLDYENRKLYTLTVIARDNGLPTAKQSTITLKIHVKDDNDETPLFATKNITFSVVENISVGTKIGKVIALDRDSGDNGRISYYIVAGNVFGIFGINTTTGELYSIREIDYEESSSHNIGIKAVDNSNINPRSSTISVKVKVLDVNDNPPKFEKDPIVLTVRENSPIGYLIHAFTAMDKDSGVNGSIGYTIDSLSPVVDYFTIENQNGKLRVSKSIDFEKVQSVSLIVKAQDLCPVMSARLNTTVTVNILIIDENDNWPAFASPTHVTMSEDEPVGAPVSNVLATDDDSNINNSGNGVVGYTIVSGNSDGRFYLDVHSGLLSLAKPLDREVNALYQLNISAGDHGNPRRFSYMLMTVTVEDVNDNSPHFLKPTYQVDIREHERTGAFVVKIEATDADMGLNGKLTYLLPKGIANDKFTVDSVTGVITTTQQLDREVKSSYILTAYARDNGNPILYDTATVIVNVTDINDNAPQFKVYSYHLKIPENRELSVIHTFAASDLDDGDNGKILYSISSGNEDGKFSINALTGELSCHSLNREARKNYTLLITAQDKGIIPQANHCSALITVLDENDNTPKFSQNTYPATVRESDAVGTIVLQELATDPDEGDNGKVSYSLGNDTEGRFTVNSSSGLITTAGLFDREKKSSYQFVLIARDGAKDGPKSSTATITITVKDVNDNAPIFEEMPYKATFTTQIGANKRIMTVVANDADSGNNSKVLYSLSSPSDERTVKFFAIEPTTGAIRTRKILGPAEYGQYHIEVMATDQGTPPLSSIGLVEIQIGTAHSTTLRFRQASYSANLLENSPKGSPVTRVTADIAGGGTISYSIASGNRDDTFVIISQTGQISVDNSTYLDYERNNKMKLVVMAKANEEHAYTTVIVTLNDVNDNVPKFAQERYVSSVWENLDPEMFVTQVQASDPDEGRNGDIIYNIIGGNKGNAFYIDPPHTGIIKTDIVLDREISGSEVFWLKIEATDRGSPSLSSFCTLKITVVDANDNAPFLANTHPESVSEATEVGSVITTVTATDVDSDPTLTYFFAENGNPDNTFSIDKFTGDVSLAKPLDYETKKKYTVEVRVWDGGEESHNKYGQLQILVTDENDHPPEFRQQSYQIMVNALTKAHQLILTVQADDADDGNNAIITYTMLDNDDFYINSTTGSIFTKREIRYVSEQPVQLVVTAKDSGTPRLMSVAAVYVQIKDVNIYAPRFKESSYSVQVREDVKIGVFIIKVSATDADKGRRNKMIDYEIMSGNEKDQFLIKKRTGEMNLNAELDREKQDTYVLKVMAKDRGTPSLNSTVIVTVTVEDYNDQAPKFSEPFYFVTLAENFPNESVFLKVTATDDDIGENREIHYSITSGNDKGLFIINGNNGDVLVTPGMQLDYETQAYHRLIVRARDCSACDPTVPRRSAFTTIQVNITDINDHAPEFATNQFDESVYENQPEGTTVFQAVAIDHDQGEYGVVGYSIISQSNGVNFRIDDRTGWVTTARGFDCETRNEYRLQILANDKEGLSGISNFTVRILDMDEYAPVFSQTQYAFSIRGDADPGVVLGQISATDKDGGDASIIRYRLKYSVPHFVIDSSTGVITVKIKLNTDIQKGDESHRRKKRDVSGSSTQLFIEASSGLPDSKISTTVVDVSIDRTCSGCAFVAAQKNTSGLSGALLGVVIVIILIVFIIVAIIVVIALMRHRRRKKHPPTPIQHSHSFDATFDIPPLFPPRGGGPPAYTDVYTPNTSNVNTNISEISHHSASSGRGSVEDEEDEEIMAINSNTPTCLNQSHILRKTMPDSGIQDDDNGSERSAQNHQEYLARLGIDSSQIKVKNKPGYTYSVESMHQFSDADGGERETELDFGHVDYQKMSALNNNNKSLCLNDSHNDHGFHEPDMSHKGALTNVINSEEEFSGSYNWDYLLDWGPQYQPLAHVFAEIAKLKDDNIQPKKQPVKTVPQRQISTSLHSQVRTFPPPIITADPPKSVNHPSNFHSSQPSSGSSSQSYSTRASSINTSLPSMPRSPISYESSFTTPALTPSFTPSLSPLATRSPSPIVSAHGMSSSNQSSGHSSPRDSKHPSNHLSIRAMDPHQEFRI